MLLDFSHKKDGPYICLSLKITAVWSALYISGGAFVAVIASAEVVWKPARAERARAEKTRKELARAEKARAERATIYTYIFFTS